VDHGEPQSQHDADGPDHADAALSRVRNIQAKKGPLISHPSNVGVGTGSRRLLGRDGQQARGTIELRNGLWIARSTRQITVAATAIHLNACDHPEYFRVAGKPIAIVAHNYELDVDGLRRLVSDLNGALVLHEPPAGKAAAWYFPGHALPMCLTRPDITEIVWPTDEEMAATVVAYAFA
jgi:hypothetical protein